MNPYIEYRFSASRSASMFIPVVNALVTASGVNGIFSPIRGRTIGRVMATTMAAIKYFQKESMNNPAPKPIMNQMTAIIVSRVKAGSIVSQPFQCFV
jgi:hypothetical protein